MVGELLILSMVGVFNLIERCCLATHKKNNNSEIFYVVTHTLLLLSIFVRHSGQNIVGLESMFTAPDGRLFTKLVNFRVITKKSVKKISVEILKSFVKSGKSPLKYRKWAFCCACALIWKIALAPS